MLNSSDLKDIKDGWTRLAKRQHTKQSNARMEKCVECPHLNKLIYKCRKCGCFMPAKVLLPHKKCPVNKWKIE